MEVKMAEDRDHTYHEGLQEGRIMMNERAITALHLRVDKIEERLSAVERVQYIIMGGILVFQAVPLIKEVVG
jgi:hypothetical protein